MDKGEWGNGPSGLLPWQGALLAGVLGILAIRYPLESFLCLIILWLAWVGLGGRGRTGLGMVLVFFLGLGLAWVRLPAVPDAPAFVGSGKAVQIQGIVDEVESKPNRRLSVMLSEVTCTLDDGEEIALPGRLAWAWHSPFLRPESGSQVSLKSRVNTVDGFANPGGWDYAFFQRTRDISFRTYSRGSKKELAFGPAPGSGLYGWRARLLRSLDKDTSGQGGAMLTALLTGDRFDLAPETINLLRRAGLSHTLALSGLHLGFVVLLGVGLAWLVTVFWPRLLLTIARPKLAVLLAAPLVLGYLWMGGFTPSLLRAACMFFFMAVLLLQGRGRVLIDGLFLALALILIASPLSAFDIRLQLSVLAVAGIGIFLPFILTVPLRAVSRGLPLVSWPLGVLAVSFVATLSILPLTARTFGMAAPNLLLNLAWLPLLGFAVMPLGVLGIALHSLPGLDPAASYIFGLAGDLLETMLGGLQVVQGHGLLPMVQLLRPLWPEMVGAAVLLACLAAVLRGRRNWWPVMLGLVLLAGPHVAVMIEDGSGVVRLDVVDVGQGQSLVITAPGGARTIIDGGGLRSRTFDTGRDVVAPFLTLGRPPRLFAVLLTHPHADHYKGLLHLLRYFEVDFFAHGGQLPGGRYRELFLQVLTNKQVLPFYAGDVLDLGQGLALHTLHPSAEFEPPSTNDISLIQRLVWHGKGLAVMCGDAENPALEQVLAADEPLIADVLVLPHHGSATSFLPGFYARVSPRVALCSSGLRNHRIQPFPKVLAALDALDCQVRSTWDEGMLRVSWSLGEEGFEIQSSR